MPAISVFDILKIGVGPSSSHTLGPWRAAQRFTQSLQDRNLPIQDIKILTIHLFGSLSLTGKGHATDLACVLGLNGEDPVTIDVSKIDTILENIKREKKIAIEGILVPFDFEQNIHFHKEFLPFHPNGMTLEAVLSDGSLVEETYYSIGGGFVIQENDQKDPNVNSVRFPYPIEIASQLLQYCKDINVPIHEVVSLNEKSIAKKEDISEKLMAIWNVMLESMYIGCHTQGTLPGGLEVRRRAYDIHAKLNTNKNYHNKEEWLESLRKLKIARFQEILKWISCFALAVNEVNASLGRVVTAPTNGSSGVIPAVLMYYLCFINTDAEQKEIEQFLLTAGEIGSIFKKGATISAAMGGCQAEIGVSSAMAAGALCELLGGTPEQVLGAAEIAMEHHLGLTCDPIAGLVQIPCIERNSMGAIKAISATELALETDTQYCKISLDTVVKTMMETAKDMNRKYKETSEGGLAVFSFIADC